MKKKEIKMVKAYPKIMKTKQEASNLVYIEARLNPLSADKGIQHIVETSDIKKSLEDALRMRGYEIVPNSQVIKEEPQIERASITYEIQTMPLTGNSVRIGTVSLIQAGIMSHHNCLEAKVWVQFGIRGENQSMVHAKVFSEYLESGNRI